MKKKVFAFVVALTVACGLWCWNNAKQVIHGMLKPSVTYLFHLDIQDLKLHLEVMQSICVLSPYANVEQR